MQGAIFPQFVDKSCNARTAFERFMALSFGATQHRVRKNKRIINCPGKLLISSGSVELSIILLHVRILSVAANMIMRSDL
mgnify:CR=1 FL=1